MSNIKSMIDALPAKSLMALRVQINSRLSFLGDVTHRVGSEVTFSYQGVTHEGIIQKINPKNHSVRITQSTKWPVGGSVKVPKDWLIQGGIA